MLCKLICHYKTIAKIGVRKIGLSIIFTMTIIALELLPNETLHLTLDPVALKSPNMALSTNETTSLRDHSNSVASRMRFMRGHTLIRLQTQILLKSAANKLSV